MPALQQMVRDLRVLVEEQQALLAVIPQLQASFAQLQEQVRELAERTNRHSGNFSQPLSSDPLWRQRTPKHRPGKKRGGQRGHPGHYRHLASSSAVDHVVVCAPDACGRCGVHFPESSPPRRRFRRFQVVELLPIRPEITEYQVTARYCRDCVQRPWAACPKGVNRCAGLRVQALAPCSPVPAGCRAARPRRCWRISAACSSRWVPSVPWRRIPPLP